MLNTSGRCSNCGAIVRNVEHKRHPIERLTAIHDDSCPGIWRVKKR